jgi:glycosyltransferase involved in cell wall biosynthesis
VVALFGRRNASRAFDHAEAALAALARARGARGVVVLNLGADTPRISAPLGVDVRTPGPLTPDELSLRLRAADVLLLPLTDGVSTRRTTMMTALAHGLPVVGLSGVNTDRVLLDHPEALMLTPAGDREAYARAAADLVADPARLRALGAAGRRLYAAQFDWPVTARRMSTALGSAPGELVLAPAA